MKHLFNTFLACSLLAISCNSSSTNTKSTQDTLAIAQDSLAFVPQSIGGDKDEHGCLSAAGQTWSQIKNDCIQVFTVGIRLNPMATKGDEAVISAFVVPNTDSTAYELFLAEDKNTVILDRTADNTFSKDKYSYNSKSGELLIDNKLVYKAE